MDTLSPVLTILAGLILLFSGRRVFWLAAALAAFLFTYRLLANWLEPGPLGLVIAAVIGLLFAFLAINFIKTVGVLIGALAGALALPYLLGLFGVDASWWILAVVGAVIGIIIVSVAFNWGLIVMTAWVGANVVTDSAAQLFPISPSVSTVLFLGLLAAGIAAQAGMVKRRKR